MSIIVMKNKISLENELTLRENSMFSGAEISGFEESETEREDIQDKYRSGSLSPSPPPKEFLRNFTNISEIQRQSRWKPLRDPKNNFAKQPISIDSQLNNFQNGDVKNSVKDLQLQINNINPEIHDNRVGSRPATRTPKKGSFQFFQQGTLLKKEKRISQLLDRQYIHNKPSPAALHELEIELDYRSDEELLQYEWWDAFYLNKESGKLNLRLITDLIHVPAMLGNIENQVETQKQLPLYLTKQEKDKIRRKKTKDKHDAMIDEIRLGLRPSPEPHLKLSNIVRVLGSQFIQDPSAAEAKARAQMTLRKMKHQLHNESRKLTKIQKSEKKRRKLLEDTSKQVQTAVFRVNDLSDSKIRWKIKTNAKQYNLTGCMLIFKRMNMIILEGGQKNISRYKALMERRIKWSKEQIENPCVKVWEGTLVNRVFRDFIEENFEDEKDVIKYLDQKRILSYWKQCNEHEIHLTY